jgi:hypothetical protein
MFDLLQSILAFVLTMLGLATLVTVIMEMIGRFTRRRARVLRHVLELVFEKEIQPILNAKVTLTEQRIRDAIDVIVASPFKPATGENGFFKGVAWLMKSAFGADESRDLTARDVLVRLSRTEVGTELYDAAKADWDAAIERIETRYDELSAAASEWFKNSSAVGSLVIGVCLALALNVDGMRVFDFFLKNPDQAAAVVGDAEQYLKAHETMQARVAEARETLATAAPDDQAARAEAEIILAEVDETYAAIGTQRRQLSELGLPTGAGFFPYCRPTEGMPSPDERCKAKKYAYFGHLVGWLFIVLLSGVLIGLGGPFWYNAATGLLRVTQMMRGKAPPADAAAPPPPPHAPRTAGALQALYEHRTAEKEDVK